MLDLFVSMCVFMCVRTCMCFRVSFDLTCMCALVHIVSGHRCLCVSVSLLVMCLCILGLVCVKYQISSGGFAPAFAYKFVPWVIMCECVAN